MLETPSDQIVNKRHARLRVLVQTHVSVSSLHMPVNRRPPRSGSSNTSCMSLCLSVTCQSVILVCFNVLYFASNNIEDRDNSIP